MPKKIQENKANRTLETTKMLNVPSPAIHIENKISLVQKKLWFELVYESFPKMGNQRKYSITLKKLRQLLGWNEGTSNDKELKEALKGLNETAITWNIFGKDNKNSWQCFPLLAGCEIPKNSGLCIYSLSPFLEDRFLAMGEEAYVKIDLIISKKFQSKYSLSLYCLALDFLMLNIGYSEKKFTVEELRTYLGLKEDEYKLIGHFNDRVIKTAEDEINKKSDINIEIKPYKEFGKKKIIGYKFCMSLKEGRIKEYIEKNNKLKIISSKLIAPLETSNMSKVNIKPDLISVSNESLNEFFAYNSISLTPKTIQNKLKELKEKLGESFEDYLVFLMEYTKKESNKSNIKSISGFYIGLIKDDLQVSNYKVLNQKDIQKKEESKEKLNIILEERLKKKYTSEMFEDFTNYLLMNQDNLEEKITELLNENLRDKNQFVYDMLMKQFGELDIRALTESSFAIKSAVVGFLKNYKEELEYPETSFEYWREKIFKEDGVRKLREEIEKGLKG